MNDQPDGDALLKERAIALYAAGEISLGCGARMCKLPRWAFEDLLAKRHIPIICITLDQLNEELRPFEQ